MHLVSPRPDRVLVEGPTAGVSRVLRRCQPGSLPFLCLLLLATGAASVVWTNKALRNNNLEWQGFDIMSHALMVTAEAHWLPPEVLGYDQAYPRTAHALAAALLPILHDSPIRAMRAVALIALFTILGTQYTLLCRVIRPVSALIILVLWQWLAGWTRFADLNHFTHGSYLFSQAVGVGSFWLVLALASTDFQSRAREWFGTLVAFGFASGAYACHLVPGALAFGTLGVFFTLRGFQNRNKADFLRLFLTILVGTVTIFSSAQWRLMASARGTFNESWLPYDHLWLLLAWIPTFAVAVVRLAGRLGGRHGRPPLTDVELIVGAGLIVSGSLQTYFAYEWGVAGTTSAYTVKKFFFFTLPFASLLWVTWLSRAWQTLGLRVAVPQGAALAAAAGLAATGLYQVVADDVKRPYPGRAYDPAYVACQLGRQRDKFAWCYYYDPEHPMNSLYATVVGLRVNRDLAVRCWEGLTFRDRAPISFWRLIDDGHFGRVLLPAGTVPDQVFQVPVPTVEQEGFLRCDVHAAQARNRALSWAALTSQ